MASRNRNAQALMSFARSLGINPNQSAKPVTAADFARERRLDKIVRDAERSIRKNKEKPAMAKKAASKKAPKRAAKKASKKASKKAAKPSLKNRAGVAAAAKAARPFPTKKKATRTPKPNVKTPKALNGAKLVGTWKKKAVYMKNGKYYKHEADGEGGVKKRGTLLVSRNDGGPLKSINRVTGGEG